MPKPLNSKRPSLTGIVISCFPVFPGSDSGISSTNGVQTDFWTWWLLIMLVKLKVWAHYRQLAGIFKNHTHC